MNPLLLHELHHSLSAQFTELNGAEIVADYGDWRAEYKALREAAGVIDLSFRGRICLLGNDRVRFLHGQITNDVKKTSSRRGLLCCADDGQGQNGKRPECLQPGG